MSELIPDGWNNIAIDDFIERVIDNRGKTPPLSDTGYGLIEIGALSESGRFPNYSRIRKRVDANTFDTWFRAGHPKKGDILIPTVGTIGICCILDKTLGSIAQNLIALRVKPENNPVYAYYILSSYWTTKQIEMIVMNAVQPSLRVPQFLELKALQPPLPEQQKIAAILSSVDEVIEKTQAQINKLKDLKTGMMQELLSPREGQVANINNPQGESEDSLHHTEFKDSPLGRIPVGWDVKSFSDIFELKNGVNKGKESFGNGVPIISYRNVYDRDGITDEKITGLVEMNESELSRFHSQHGDIFITRTSETPDEIGYANVYLGCRSDVVFSGFVIRARQITKVINPIYSLYAFQTHSIREQMIHNSKFTTRAGISGESLSRLKIAVPPIEEQTKIAEALTSITNRIDSLELKNKSTKSIKKALMQDLLTGKVRVNVD